MKDSGPGIFLSAGEPSGDQHGAELAREIRRRWPAARLYGFGGPAMAEQGVELLADPDELAVMGFVEVLARLPFFLSLQRSARAEITERRPDLVLPIDYPGFNLRLARDAHRQGVPVLYYIAPQVWAWRKRRARALARYADHLAVALPFEEQLFRDAGVPTTFVGNPLLDQERRPVSRQEFSKEVGVDPDREILALFPGSRRQELDRHLELFTSAAELVRNHRPGLQPILATAPGVSSEGYNTSELPRTEDSWSLLRHARAALVKSGTGTLQAALARSPMVIAYRTHPVTYWLARRLVRVDHVGLVNLVADRRIVPEFLQGAATPAALADALVPMLEEGATRAKILADLNSIESRLEPEGPRTGTVAGRVIDVAHSLVDR